MNAPCPPPNPCMPGMQNWCWNGSRWVCTAAVGTIVITKVFTASGPYSPSPGLQSLTVETIGGGGGGGGAVALNTNANFGGGGGSGGYSRKTLAAPVVAGGVQVTIGVGGAGAVQAATAAAGSPTTFGALCTSNGGSGGGSAGFGGNYNGGAGALPGVGDIAFLGAAGESGGAQTPPTTTQLIVHGGAGGSVWGGNSPGFDVGLDAGADGNAGWPNTGAGGGGAATLNAPAPSSGGAGGSGLCIVTEYCWADAGDTGCGCGTTGGARVAAPAGWQGGFDD